MAGLMTSPPLISVLERLDPDQQQDRDRREGQRDDVAGCFLSLLEGSEDVQRSRFPSDPGSSR